MSTPTETPIPAPSSISLSRDAVVVATKLLSLAHQQGFFSKFAPEEAMRHLSVIVYLENQLK